MEKEKETYKIKTLKGRIVTLSLTGATCTHLMGTDKFNKTTILAIKDIDSMYPIGDFDE